MEDLFVYGTLKDSRRRRKVIVRKIEGMADYIKGYRKSRVKIEGKFYPILHKSKINKVISGMVLRLTHNELKALDKYETNIYKREKVILESGKKAWVYVKS